MKNVLKMSERGKDLECRFPENGTFLSVVDLFRAECCAVVLNGKREKSGLLIEVVS